MPHPGGDRVPAFTPEELYKLVDEVLPCMNSYMAHQRSRYPAMRRLRHAPVYRPLLDLATMEDRHIIQTYHLNRKTTMDLCTQLEPDHTPVIRNPYDIPPTVQVLSVLHFLATGSFQNTVALTAGMPQPMFSLVLKDVLYALLKHLDGYIWVPERAHLAYLKADFYDMGHIPHVIGAMDGTHRALVPPSANEQVYRNRKNYHSINVQVVCLADQYISQVRAKFQGSVNDSYILRNSNVPHMMAHYTQRGLGSECVTLPRKMTSFFNEAHIRMKRVMERTFGFVKARFRCLDASGGALFYSSQKACQIIVASCMLHNVALRRQIPLLADDDEAAGPVTGNVDMESDEEADEEGAADSKTELNNHYFQ
ncbi:putative nuclease HARBI1 [Pleurodeles waltl]|uniref:putative nuclease HARBI1 n=1 Tax=Pleurodeles waltl TaxID=8319 RepID=UPI003709531B